MSTVTDNLMNEPGYTPYCGNPNYYLGGDQRIDPTLPPCNMPRTKFDGEQFACTCGWRSAFPDEFIAAYKAKWSKP